MYADQIILEMHLEVHAAGNPLGNQESLDDMKKKEKDPLSYPSGKFQCFSYLLSTKGTCLGSMYRNPWQHLLLIMKVKIFNVRAKVIWLVRTIWVGLKQNIPHLNRDKQYLIVSHTKNFEHIITENWILPLILLDGICKPIGSIGNCLGSR